MTAQRYGRFAAAVPDLHQTPLGPQGTCPACRKRILTLKPTGPNSFEVSCAGGCIGEWIEAAVTKVVNGTGNVNGAEMPPMPEEEPSTGTVIRPEGFTAAELMEMHIEPARYAIDGYICEGLNIFAGGQKKGKSWMAYSWAIAVATGGMAFGSIPVEQGTALYLALEDGPRRLRDRLIPLLGGSPAPEQLYLYPKWPMADQGGIVALDEWIKAHRDTRLVVVDTLGRFRGSRAKNGDIFQQDYDFGARLKRLADENRIALVVLHHLSKRQCEDPFDQVSGTIAVTASADATLLLQRKRGEDHGTLFVTGRDVEEREMAVTWAKEACSWTIAGTAEEFRRSDERKEIIDLLRNQGAMTPAAVAAELKKNRSTVRTLLAKLCEEGAVRNDGGVYWASEER